MATDETHGLGYHGVDEDPNATVLLATMDATGDWAATRELREWERGHLGLAAGERLLDVGCGLGDAALALARALGAGGEIVGIDSSAAMIDAAQARAAVIPCATRFEVGDALSIGEPDHSFDAVRSERMLQWVSDPPAAVAELARVVRPAGLVSLIDSDWSTFAIDVGDDDLAARVREGLRTERGRPSNVGRHLADLAGRAGLEVVAQTSATQTWTEWDPDSSPAPTGCFSMSSLADDLVDRGQLQLTERERFVATVVDAARAGRFTMALTMFAVVARA